MKRLVAFDLDGTLAESKQAIDAEMAELAQERPQALSRLWNFRKFLAIDLMAHGALCSSARISSASRNVMCLRHAGLPWTSV